MHQRKVANYLHRGRQRGIRIRCANVEI